MWPSRYSGDLAKTGLVIASVLQYKHGTGVLGSALSGHTLVWNMI